MGNNNRLPKYMPLFYWEGDMNSISWLAEISETLSPLPSVPSKELENEVVTKTIQNNEHLFLHSHFY